MPITAIKGPYIPRADGALREWLDNFVSVIGPSPWDVGVSPDDAAKLTALAQRYAAAYVRANSPGTSSPDATARKDGTTVVPITGGTGAFAGATGTVIIGKGQAKSPNTYIVTVPHALNLNTTGVA